MSQRKDDLIRLTLIADELDALNDRVAALTEQRRTIWQRRTKHGDTTKVALAAASHCGAMNVTHGLRVVAQRKARK